VFSEDTLQQALEIWKTREIKEHPEHQKTIETTVVAMTTFFNSKEVKQLNMTMLIDH
jgi:hypothetical protein